MDLDGSGTVEYTGIFQKITTIFKMIKEFLAATVSQK
jgi:hypothetical protein